MTTTTYNLDAIAQGVRKCSACELAGKFGLCVPGWQAIDRPEVMIIGEAPGASEAIDGVPFVGRAGRVLNEYLAMAGLSREQVFITNTVKARPTLREGKNTPPPPNAIAACTELWLTQELQLLNPKVVVPVGATAMRWFLPEIKSVSQAHGIARNVSIPGVWSGVVYPCYHPAAVLHNPKILGHLEADFRGLGVLLDSMELGTVVVDPSKPDTTNYFETTDTQWLD